MKRIRLKHQVLAEVIDQSTESQNRWAQRLGVSRGHFSMLLSGKRPYPQPETRDKLLEGTRLSFAELFEVELDQSSRSVQSGDVRPAPGPQTGADVMEQLWSDLRFAFRAIAARPAFTIAAVLALSLGIGANTAIFSVLNAVVLEPLPYPEPERLVMLWENNFAEGDRRERSSPVNYTDYRALDVFEDLAGWWYPNMNLTDTDNEPIRVNAIEVTRNFFEVLGVGPQRGRTFEANDSLFGPELEVVISHRLWRSRYGERSNMVGSSINLNGEAYVVTGIMPPAFHFPSEMDVWFLMGWNPVNHSRNAQFFEIVGRLSPQANLEQAQGELSALMERIRAENTNLSNLRADVVSLHDEVVGLYGPALAVLLGAVGLLLLLACANVANLLLARASAREREVAIRSAMGASRGRLLRQFLTESAVLGGLGAAMGLFLAWAGTRWLVASAPVEIPRLDSVVISGQVLLFTLGVTFLTAILFGLVPALQMSGTSLQDTLKEGGRGATTGSGGRRTRNVLVVAEVALAVILLVGAGLLIRSFSALLQESPGFVPDETITVNVELPRANYRDWNRVSRFTSDLVAGLSQQAGITSAGASGFLPLSQGWQAPFSINDRPTPPQDEIPQAQYVTVTEGYFETLRIPLLAGRFPAVRDTAETPGVVVINQEMVRRHFPDDNPVGKVMTIYAGGIGPLGRSLMQSRDFEVIGVAGDFKNNSLQTAVEPAIFFTHRQYPYNNLNIVVRGNNRGGALARAVRATVAELDPALPLSEVKPMEQLLSESVSQPRFIMMLMTGFAVLALVLAAVGIYGVLSYAVSQRRHEIGVRMALGAEPGKVRSLVVGEGMVLAVAGLIVGSVGALALTRFMSSLLFGVQSRDAVTFIGVSALVFVVALAACYIPARRASGLDPLKALRIEQS